MWASICCNDIFICTASKVSHDIGVGNRREHANVIVVIHLGSVGEGYHEQCHVHVQPGKNGMTTYEAVLGPELSGGRGRQSTWDLDIQYGFKPCCKLVDVIDNGLHFMGRKNGSRS